MSDIIIYKNLNQQFEFDSKKKYVFSAIYMKKLAKKFSKEEDDLFLNLPRAMRTNLKVTEK